MGLGKPNDQTILTFTRTENVNTFKSDRYNLEVCRDVTVRVLYTPDITWSQNCPKCDALHLWEGHGTNFSLKNCVRSGKAAADTYRCKGCKERVVPLFKVVEEEIKGPLFVTGWFSWTGSKPKRDVLLMESYDLPVKGRVNIVQMKTMKSCMVFHIESEKPCS